jgi:hypothetical protein
MSTDDNIVKLPDRLERRAQKIDAAITRRGKADADWREATLELAVELAGARADHGKNDSSFGKWLDGRFGDNVLPPKERSILIRWGNDPDQTRIILEKTESRSIQGIDLTFVSSNKGPPAKPAPKREMAQTYALAVEATSGKLPTAPQIARDVSVSPCTATNVLRDIRSRRSEADGPVVFTKAQEAHVNAAITRRTRELEDSFSERIRKAAQELYDKNFPDFQEELNRAHRTEKYYRKLIDMHQPILTDAEFLLILACLHPDNSASNERRETAFRTFNAVKFRLTGKA